MRKVILTGGTGYLGRHVLSALLARGFQVLAISRRRAEKLEERFGPPTAGLHVFEGDVAQAGCGLDAAALAGLAGAEAFVHCAGLTQFDAHLEEELRLQNAVGTENAFGLCRKLGVPRFHHVSTAFAAGPGYRNPYERSKADAETFLAAQTGGPAILVYRPSIVVGGRVLGETSSAGTLYAYLKSLRFIRECFRYDASHAGRLAARYGSFEKDGVWNVPLRVEGDPATRIDLVHAADVAAAILRDIVSPPAAGRAVALTSGRPFTAAEIKESFCRALGLEGIEWVPAGFLDGRATPMEEKYRRMTVPYRPYLFDMPDFEAAPGVRRVDLDGIARAFLSELEQREAGPSGGGLGSLAVDCLDVERPGRYLDKFSDGQFGESLLKRVAFVEAKVHFHIRGAGIERRTILFDRGVARPLEGDEAEEPDFCYELDEAVFRRIVTGRLDPREAFFKGLLKISGDQERALKFGYLFTEHFLEIDHRIVEELEGRA